VANDLKERPAESSDDEQKKPLFGSRAPDVHKDSPRGVYDDSPQRENLGVHPERREAEVDDLNRQFSAPSAEKSSSPEQILANEQKPGKGTGQSPGSDDEAESLNYTGGPAKKPGRIRSRITKGRAAVGVGITGIFIGGAFGIFSILHGPLQLVHFAQLLQKFHFSNNEDFMDGRAGRYLRHMFSGDAERGRLGFVRDRIATKVEARLNNRSGVRSIYSDPPSRRLIGYEVIDSAKAQGFISELDKQDVNTDGSPRGSASGGGTPDPNNRFIDLETNKRGDIKGRRQVTRAAVRSTGLGKISGRLASRLLIQRGGVDFHPFKNMKRKAGESLVDFYKRHKDERSERRKRGVNAPDKRLAGSEQDTDGDGEPDSNTNNEADQGNQFADEAADAATPDGRNGLVNKIISGGGAAGGVAAALCIVNDIGEGIEEYKYANIILVMLRIGMEIVTGGEQTKSNIDTNIDENGAANDDLYDDENESSWVSAASIQAELGQEVTGPDLPPDAKPGAVGEKPALFKAVGEIPGITGACGAVSSIISVIPGISQVVNFVSNLATSGINSALTRAGFPTIEEFFESVVKFFAGEVVNTYAKGAELGNIANYGTLLAANDQAIASGGSALTDTETAELDTLARAEDRLEQAQKPLYARLFDTGEVDSLVVQASLSLPRSPQATIAAILNAPARLFSSLASTLGGGLVFAQAGSNYDYGKISGLKILLRTQPTSTLPAVWKR
jgi:hypothetical protein